MSKLLKCLRHLSRLNLTEASSSTLTTSVNHDAKPSWSITRCYLRTSSQSTAIWKPQGLGPSTNLSSPSNRGQATTFNRSRFGLCSHDFGGFPLASTACFHTSSHQNGRVSNFLTRHRQGLGEAPLPALMLGLSGLIPFVAPAVYTAATVTVTLNILWAQAAYGASILSFLGGVRWGFALTEKEGVGPTWSMLGYSVMPSLVAWLGLLMPLQASQICIMSGLLLAWAADISVKAYPAWFRSLRLILSLFALLSLGVSYGFCLIYEPTSEKYGSNVVKLIKIVKIILED
ncbi:transmembrane protein 69-like [Patiria miniata]|uniref:Transmembrane protein 69 n=1 Tax=Patiria miniata TaxID=46514 RepID=A0A914AWC1_PATMI|nr:transmembrane protein 69-like [Patiria miniata]